MMRRTLCVLALVMTAAVPASSQTLGFIKKPIDAAKKQANKTSEQINNEQKVGNDAGSKSAAMPAAAAQAASKAAQQKGAADTKAVQADTTPKRGTVTQSGSKGQVTFYREVFSYPSEGRRDPFLSLMVTGELRPMVTDLTLVGIIYDESGRNSVAILVDASAGGQTYRKKVGDVLGRMKVSRITERDVTLIVDEFGFARQETLLIDRNPRTGPRRPQ